MAQRSETDWVQIAAENLWVLHAVCYDFRYIYSQKLPHKCVMLCNLNMVEVKPTWAEWHTKVLNDRKAQRNNKMASRSS